MSLIEAVANVAVGYGVALGAQLVVFPSFGLPARVADVLGIGAVFRVLSLIRGFLPRRLFERVRVCSELRRRARLQPARGTPSSHG